MSTKIKSKKNQAAVTLPLTALKCLYKSAHGKKIVCEINVDALKTVNAVDIIDEMVAEAHLEYVSGKTRGFTDAHKLLAYLNK